MEELVRIFFSRMLMANSQRTHVGPDLTGVWNWKIKVIVQNHIFLHFDRLIVKMWNYSPENKE
jgi:hypothetical protein